ncbi:hypothetical protein [Veillonella sp. VA139]|uniref:hypothetical protein n=1 Tax=Veillonella sp. VA139 TaxID=741830 RepID=UPI000F8E09C8|nr:hypothetical protein [Veillonella sp. VA139]
MNRFLRRGQLQTIESQKDPSVVEDMNTLVSEVSSDEFLDMVQQEGSPKDLNRAMDMVEMEESEENRVPVDPYESMTIRDYSQLDVLPENSDEGYGFSSANETEQDRFFHNNYNDIMEDELEYDEHEADSSYDYDSGDSFDFDFDVDFDLFDNFDDD